MLAVERFYLRKYSMSSPSQRLDRRLHQFSPDASFSERFYGLKRRRRPYIDMDRALAAVGGVPKQERLRDRDISRSLIFLVGH